MLEKLANILIVDDEPSSMQILCNILEGSFNLHLATTGEEGIAVFKKNDIDLVLMDVDLPDMSGFDAVKQIFQAKDSIPPKVFFVSGYDDLVFEVQAFKAGAVDYLVKPISPVRVLIRVNVHLNVNAPLPGLSGQLL